MVVCLLHRYRHTVSGQLDLTRDVVYTHKYEGAKGGAKEL